MDIFRSICNYVLRLGHHSLWINRLDGKFTLKEDIDVHDVSDLDRIGSIDAYIGRIRFFHDCSWYLLVVSSKTVVGKLPGGHLIYCINKVAALPLSRNSPAQDLQVGHRTTNNIFNRQSDPEKKQVAFSQAWNSLKYGTTLPNKSQRKSLKAKEKLERRLLEELCKMFNDSGSFYYSPTGDMTNSMQRLHATTYDSSLPLWQRVDPRFFWNKFMLKDLLDSKDPEANIWITPIMQGCIQIERFNLPQINEDLTTEAKTAVEQREKKDFNLILIARRSRFRAGTRYKRRGIDKSGACANFVETEQIIVHQGNALSLVITRGSIPLFWSQPGIQYRPPPLIEKGEEEAQLALGRHLNELISIYGKLAIISLIDQTGREKVVHDAFLENIITNNSPDLTFISFDFHEYCKGLQFENISILLHHIKDVIQEMKFCWIANDGAPICQQNCIMRVNCMDCLDRTNVVQAAIARVVLETQLKKLGCLLPEESLPQSCRLQWQGMWANCGDAISRQYAGTDALKGDYTRTGERNVKGVMKDGYNSANRYYLNRFKDTYRQAVIDIILGNPVTEEFLLLNLKRKMQQQLKKGEEWSVQREESAANVIAHCQRLLVPETEDHVAGWMLINPHFCTSSGTDEDVALLLTTNAVYLASYDDENERVTTYRSTILEHIELIEIGMMASLFKSKFIYIRLHFIHDNCTGYFYTLRNLHSRTIEDSRDRMMAIADAIVCTCGLVKKKPVPVIERRLERVKSKDPNDMVDLSFMSRANTWFSNFLKPIKSGNNLALSANNNQFRLSQRLIRNWREKWQFRKPFNQVKDIFSNATSKNVKSRTNSTSSDEEYVGEGNPSSEESNFSGDESEKTRNQLWQSHSRLATSTGSICTESKCDLSFLCNESNGIDRLDKSHVDLNRTPSCPELQYSFKDKLTEHTEPTKEMEQIHDEINKNRFFWSASIDFTNGTVRLSKVRPGNVEKPAKPMIKISNYDSWSDFEVIDSVNTKDAVSEDLSDQTDDLDMDSMCTICGKYKRLTDVLRDDFVTIGFKCASCSESSRNASENEDAKSESNVQTELAGKSIDQAHSEDEINEQLKSSNLRRTLPSFPSESLAQFRDSFRNRFSNAFVSKKTRRKRLHEIEVSQMQERLKELNCQTKFILI